MSSKRMGHTTGIGLVDLMVGLLISLIAMLVIIKVAILFDARRRSTTGFADAQMNVASATLLMARDVRIAGQGFGSPDSLGCHILHGKAKLGGIALLPVEIMNGESGQPDRLRILASATVQITPAATLIADHPASAITMQLDSTLGISPSDHLLLQEPTKPCALLGATSVPVGGYRVNHSLLSVSGLPDYTAGARVINLGALHFVEFFVDANDYLQVNRYLVASDEWHSSAMASGVVSLQAQYGFDMQSSTAASPKVTHWSDTMIDADLDNIVGDNGDLRRLIAVRLAIVVRSAERNDRGCDASLPQWMAGNEATGILQLTNIPLAHIADWRCYRYRVLQTEIPLRNLLWSDV